MEVIIIDEPNVDNQANAGLAVDLQRQCMEKILPLLNIEPDQEITQQDMDAYEVHTGHAWKQGNTSQEEEERMRRRNGRLTARLPQPEPKKKKRINRREIGTIGGEAGKTEDKEKQKTTEK